ncbi:TPA: hypothetical protein QDC51_000582 [Burkholderia multivorans]|uniref:hypothetical protein n=1 Tax=Burkholderia multivorans TaxID=87883 RepID=UPI001C22C58D|nr:hypothetical protein [Burkholderia multivorans]MBU9349224.1 hypothetical protein [Burkholderia multivorans]MBU9392485.1 hypothetical protein [Burkholderia multivorans]HDR9833837.1 hypothetical protein [Burkholderia multivorans]HDR9841519.1 hypothetical protein [Burkholderia multivorans]HDR9846539.1 hypothetical protein [Burkholderia multivorans]
MNTFGSLGLAPPAARATLARKVGEGGAVGTQLSKPAEASVRAGAAAPQTAQYTSRT